MTSFYNMTIDLIQKNQIGTWSTCLMNAQMLHIHSFIFMCVSAPALRQTKESADEFYAKINRMEQVAVCQAGDKIQRVQSLHTETELTEPLDTYNHEIWDDVDRETVVDEEPFYNEE